MVLTCPPGRAPGGLELLGWQTLDAQNRRTTVRLSNHQYGLGLSDDLFRYLDVRARPHK
jgi:outer membrane lipoprotein-sorting protein